MGTRERLRLVGSAALTDAEVVAALIGTGEAADTCARELLATYGDLPSIGRADVADLARQIGGGKACALAAALEIGRRAQAPRRERLVVSASRDVNAYLAPQIAHLQHEVFHVLCLDAKNRLLRDVRVVEGGLTTCSVLPREVFAPALREGACGVIFAHNTRAEIRLRPTTTSC